MLHVLTKTKTELHVLKYHCVLTCNSLYKDDV